MFVGKCVSAKVIIHKKKNKTKELYFNGIACNYTTYSDFFFSLDPKFKNYIIRKIEIVCNEVWHRVGATTPMVALFTTNNNNNNQVKYYVKSSTSSSSPKSSPKSPPKS